MNTLRCIAHGRLAWPLLSAALALGACGLGRGPESPEPHPPAVRLYYDNGGGIQDSLRVVVRDATELQRVWQAATSRQDSPPPVPAIDFENDMLVVVAAGRMTPDDQIAVDSVSVRREMNPDGRMVDVLNITVRTTTGCLRFNADAYPLEIVRLRRFDGRIEFTERRHQAEGCRARSGTGPGSA